MVTLYDTTLRDGEQTSGVDLLLTEKLQITKILDDYGVTEIEGGFPSSNKTDFEYFKRIKELKLKNAKIFAFGRTKKEDLEIMFNTDADGFTIVGKADTRQVENVLKTNPKDYLKTVKESIEYLKKSNKIVYFDAEHFFDGFKYNKEYALKVLEAAVSAGADLVVLCDTNGNCFPKEVYDIISEIKNKIKAKIGFHGHNDRGFADANSYLAYEAGAEQIQGSINRLGERCGNANLLTLACNLFSKGIINGLKIENTMDVSKSVEVITGFRVSANEPFVGINAGAHLGGMHVDGMEKMNAYQFFDLRLVGNRIWYPFSKMAGGATIVSEANKYGISLKKGDKITLDLLKEIESHGKVGDAQFYLLLNKLVSKKEEPFEVTRRTNIDVYDSGLMPETLSEATVHLNIKNQIEHAAGKGDGPVHAMDEALRTALRKHYPVIDKAELLFYDVAAKRSHLERGTAAYVDVFVEFIYNGNKWTSLARHTDIIRASEKAIIDSQKYFLMHLAK